MPLQLKDTIHLKTPLGPSEVQLLCGDITDLPMAEAVDIIIVSSFLGDYFPSHGTLLHGLDQNLNISVQKLAQNKEIDMRQNFHCWVSKPLPDNVPFKRLVCFERQRRSNRGSTSMQISQLYRAMTPIFNNEDTTIITPLLATGNQGQSAAQVLKAMVDGACHWILAGLPLRCMKLVLFTSDPGDLDERDRKSVELFKTLKSTWQSANGKKSTEVQDTDVYISHSSTDSQWVDVVSKQLRTIQPKLSVVSKQLVWAAEAVWQDDIFNIMMQSKRIIIIVSPAYVGSEECLEQFSIALCINRLSKQHQICPMYLETVPALPSYMQIVQYVECRERKEGEKSTVFIHHACLKLLSPEQEPALEASAAGQAVEGPAEVVDYDVFISYAHRHSDTAELLLKKLQAAELGLKIFFDKSNLTTGSSWQETLYNAMDGARCVVALMSPAYLESVVCREEYNIVLGRLLANEKVCLTPIVEDYVDHINPAFSHMPLLLTNNIDQDLDTIVSDIIALIKNGDTRKNFVKPKFSVKPIEAQENKRKIEFDKQFPKKDRNTIAGQLVTPSPSDDDKSRFSEKTTCDVVFSFSRDSLSLAIILSEIVLRSSPATTCKLISDNSRDRLALLDQARLVVVVMSDGYATSRRLMEELHLSMCRQRRETTRSVLYLIQAEHNCGRPFYLHLLPYKVGIRDKLWTDLAKDQKFMSESFLVTRNGMTGSYSCKRSERLALGKAAMEIIDILKNGSESKNLVPEGNILNIGNIHQDLDSGQPVPMIDCLRPIQSSSSNKQQREGTGDVQPLQSSSLNKQQREGTGDVQPLQSSSLNKQQREGTGDVHENNLDATSDSSSLHEFYSTAAQFSLMPKSKRSRLCVIL